MTARVNSERRVLLITGDPGSGKTSVMRRLVARRGFCRWASWTTRAPRPGEIDGLDYVFVDEATFLDAVARGQMVEHLVGPGGSRYGLPQPPAAASVTCLVAIVDEEAALRLPALLTGFECTVRHLHAPRALLEARMRGRGDAEPDIAARLAWSGRTAASTAGPA